MPDAVSGPPADDQAARTETAIALENVRLAAENVLLREDAARHEIEVDDLAVRVVVLSGLLRGMARRQVRVHRECVSWLKQAIRADGEAIETRDRLAAVRALADTLEQRAERLVVPREGRARKEQRRRETVAGSLLGAAEQIRAALDGPAEAPEVVRKDGFESTRTTSGPAEAAEPAHDEMCSGCDTCLTWDDPVGEAGAPEPARASYRMFRAVSDHMPVYGPGVFVAETVAACRCGVEKDKNDLYGGWWAWHVAHVLDDVRADSAAASADPHLSEWQTQMRGLLGKRVEVVLNKDPRKVVVGVLHHFATDGQVYVEDEDGSWGWAWPCLDIAEVPPAAAESARPAHPVKPRRVKVADYPQCPTCLSPAGELCLDLRGYGRHIFTTHAARMKLIRALGG